MKAPGYVRRFFAPVSGQSTNPEGGLKYLRWEKYNKLQLIESDQAFFRMTRRGMSNPRDKRCPMR